MVDQFSVTKFVIWQQPILYALAVIDGIVNGRKELVQKYVEVVGMEREKESILNSCFTFMLVLISSNFVASVPMTRIAVSCCRDFILASAFLVR